MSERLKSRMKKATLVKMCTVGSDDLAIFTFESHEALFPFKAGQYAHLGLDVEGSFMQRLYSIASSPHERYHLEFYVVRVSGGKFTTHLFRMREGDEIYYMGPVGKFTLDRAKGSHLLMVSTGTGLAPYMSMVRKLYVDYRNGEKAFRHVTIMQGVSHVRDLGYHEELLEMDRDSAFGFRYLPTISRPGEDGSHPPSLSRSRVNDLVRHLFGEEKSGPVEPSLGQGIRVEIILEEIPPEDTTIYVCGNPGMIRDIEQLARAHGYNDILKEDYW